MDKLTIISGTLFMAADIFAIVSLAMPDWIITDVGGLLWLINLLSLTSDFLLLYRRYKTWINVDMHDTV